MVMDRPIAQVSSTAPPASAVAPSLLASDATGAGQPASGQPASMAHVSEPVPSPQSVGREFVRQYYTLLNQAPEHLHRFYSHNSSFVHGGLESHEAVKGQHQIHQRIQELNFQDCHAKIRQVDAYSTLDDGVVVQVSGELSNNGQPMRRFMQTFVLAPQSHKKYYVHNDIFRYQDEVYGDEDSSTPPSEVNVEGAYQNSVSAMANQPAQEEVTAPVPREMAPSVATTNGHVHHVYNANVDKNAKNMKGAPVTPNAAIPPQEGNFAPKQPTGPVVVSVNPAPVAQTIPAAEVPVRQAPVASIKNLPGNNANENGNNGVSSADLSPENSPQGNTALARTAAKAHPAPTPSAPTADQLEKTAPVVQATAQVAAQPTPQAPPSEPSGPISYASLVKAGQPVVANQSGPVVTGKPPPAVAPAPAIKQEPKESGALAASTTTFVNKGTGGFRGGGSGGNRGGGPVSGGRGGMSQNPRERFVSSGGPESIDGSDSGPANMSGTGGGPPNAGRGNRKRITSATNPSSMFSDAQQLFVGNLPHDCTEESLEAVFSKFGTVADIRINNKGANQSKTTPGGARVPNFGFVVFEDERSVQECLRRKPIHLPQDNHRLNVEEKMNKFFSHRSESGGGPNQGGGGMGGNRNYDRGSQEHLGGTGGNTGGMGRGGPGGDRGRGGDRGMRGGGRGGGMGGRGGNSMSKDPYRKRSPFMAGGPNSNNSSSNNNNNNNPL